MKQLEADVVVVAAGGAGLAAAIAAADGGAKVIVFEKASATGGMSRLPEGIFAVESRLQRVKQISLTKEEVFKIFLNYTHYRADARLFKAYLDKSASTIDWLEDLGVEFVDIACHNSGFNYTWHVIKPPSGAKRLELGAGVALTRALTNKAKEKGVEILLKTPVKKILKKDNRITGVIAEDKSGEEIQANARAVIIATGGYSDNPEWINKYTGWEEGQDMFSFRTPGVTGDGIRMAWEAGAGKSEMMMQHYASGPSLAHLDALGFAFHHPNLVVNLHGERFMDEEILSRNLVFSGNAIARQKNRCAYLIFDEDTKKYYEETGLDFPGYGRPYTKIDNFDAELKKALDKGPDPTFNVFVADSLEEIADKTGINLDALRKTIDEYNIACDTGRDHLFNKNAKYLRPIRKPKFYVKKCVLANFGALGGIKINYKTEVVTEDENVIPGLYAAGNDANSLYGRDYAFILPGNTYGFAINSGRMAGENAVEYIKSCK